VIAKLHYDDTASAGDRIGEPHWPSTGLAAPGGFNGLEKAQNS